MRVLRESKIVLLILALIICASCAREAYNISYNGVIVDEETNCPVTISTVQSFCLFQQNIDESSTQKLSTHTDSLGHFALSFKKGYKISMVIEAEDYIDKFIQFKPYSKHTPDTIYLKRKIILQSSAATNKSNLP